MKFGLVLISAAGGAVLHESPFSSGIAAAQLGGAQLWVSLDFGASESRFWSRHDCPPLVSCIPRDAGDDAELGVENLTTKVAVRVGLREAVQDSALLRDVAGTLGVGPDSPLARQGLLVFRMRGEHVAVSRGDGQTRAHKQQAVTGAGWTLAASVELGP